MVILALFSLFSLFSLFAPLTDRQDLYIDVIFIVDLLLSTLIFIRYFDNKSYKEYVKHHIFDIISCIPIQFLSIFKTFRLVRLVRISRLFKLSRTTNLSRKITISNLFKFDTFKELFIYLTIYLIANAYIFREIEHVSILNSIYWVVTTITTVGYGDITPTHDVTKILAMFLMVIGVAVMGYVNGVIISVVMGQYKK
ncbi:ion channel [Lactococcus paracarnosus]|uniref:potassium channel family protein n=1 Tax=Pseudolactococcus paracarnosus TaxID=2749962 RepID=UPI001CB9C34B|nr:potassium channel family protein [Lactococcus paracarnosus]